MIVNPYVKRDGMTWDRNCQQFFERQQRWFVMNAFIVTCLLLCCCPYLIHLPCYPEQLPRCSIYLTHVECWSYYFAYRRGIWAYYDLYFKAMGQESWLFPYWSLHSKWRSNILLLLQPIFQVQRLYLLLSPEMLAIFWSCTLLSSVKIIFDVNQCNVWCILSLC